jgi:hypothetical protein
LACVAVGCTDRARPSGADGLACVLDPKAVVTECPNVAEGQDPQTLVLSDASELVLEALTASRNGDNLVVDARLAGRFWNPVDQNLYVFLGGPAPAGGAVHYALTADDIFAADVGYPVRGAIDVPHAIDVRVGVMAPTVAPYSPQVYATDPVHAVAVGEGALTALRVDGHEVHVEIPLARYYAAKGTAVPERVAVTVATERDYVGFVDQLSVPELAAGASAAAAPRTRAAMSYPRLDPRAHRFERIALRPSNEGVSLELTMAAPITDWAQTNLHVFFLPVPPYPAAKPLPDPSKTRTLPFKWSLYCAVYSPHRVFCKASHGKDFTFDTAYAERASLEAPAGIAFRELGGQRYALDVGPEHEATLRSGRATFAVIVAAGRDGVAPTTWYGSSSTTAR